MLLEILVGTAVGSGLMTGLMYWYYKRKAVSGEDTNPEPLLIQGSRERSLEQKLRNALFDSERNLRLCRQELQKLYALQLELLDGIGRVSRIEVAGKNLVFEVRNAVTGDRYFYYERELHRNVEPSIYEQTLLLLDRYQEHVVWFLQKIEFFENLSRSHRNNIERITGISKQNEQLRRLQAHARRLGESGEALHHIEKESIANELQIEDIGREIDFQEECLRQYALLNARYNPAAGEDMPDDLRAEMQRLLEQLGKEE